MIEKIPQESQGLKMQSTSAIYRVMHQILTSKPKLNQDKEHLWLMSLDTSLKIKSIDIISIGTVNAILFNPMEIYSVAMQKRAVYMALIHNHPSGEVLPSPNDIDITNRVIQLSNLHEIPLIDKLIISPKGHFSFKDTGLLLELTMNLKYIPSYKLGDKIKEILSNEEYLKKIKTVINE